MTSGGWPIGWESIAGTSPGRACCSPAACGTYRDCAGSLSPRAAAGFAVDWWSASRLRRESTLPYPAAILSQDGAQVDGYRLTYGLLAAAQRKGARIFDQTKVTRRHAMGGAIDLRTNRGPRIRARNVVIASGYEPTLSYPSASPRCRAPSPWRASRFRISRAGPPRVVSSGRLRSPTSTCAPPTIIGPSLAGWICPFAARPAGIGWSPRKRPRSIGASARCCPRSNSNPPMPGREPSPRRRMVCLSSGRIPGFPEPGSPSAMAAMELRSA